MKECDYNSPVVTNWEEISKCMFAEKCWVNPQNINEAKDYQKGDFLRVYCKHDGDWCHAENGLDGCAIYNDHNEE